MSDSGLYLHVPFCRSRCAYCDFYSQTELSLAPDWLEAVKIEAERYKDRFGLFDSLYLGGGTPTALTASQLTDLVAFLFRGFRFARDLEFTVEANPDDLTLDCATLLKDLGVNRVSLGVQSLDDEELAFLRRRHSARRAEKAFDRLRKAGFKNLSLDLIYALPGQTLQAWLKTLRHAASLQPDHLSCYQLSLGKHSLLGKMRSRGEIRKPGIEAQRRFFLATSRFLERQRYLHYEVSNFAGPGRFCRHNLKYWDGSPYLGLGPAAHSFDGETRWWNTRSIHRYLERVLRGRWPLAGKETLSEQDRYMESLLLGFRTILGVGVDRIIHIDGLESILKQLQESGLASVHRGRIVPTREGFLHADGLPLVFA